MSSSIPSSFSFEMLSRLPPQSFELQYREFRPDLEPNGGTYATNADSRVSIHLRGAPNEMLLNTSCHLSGAVRASWGLAGGQLSHADVMTSAYSVATDWVGVAVAQKLPSDYYQLGTADAVFDAQITGGADDATRALVADRRNIAVEEAIDAEVDGKKVDYRYGPGFINSSRESFNNGALPYLDNQDRVLHLANNILRGKCAKRWTDQAKVQDLAEAGFDGVGSQLSRGANVEVQYVLYDTTPAVTIPAPSVSEVVNSGGGARPWSVPLGMYCNLINSHSVVPIGLIASYSVNGWTSEFTLANLANATTSNQWPLTQTQLFGKNLVYDSAGDTSNGVNKYRNVRINVPIIKVLDPAVMDAVFSLYEKRQMVNVGGAQFPMSLRLNALGYRTFIFPLRQDQADYYFRLPSTDRSVRAIAWQVIDNTRNDRNTTDLVAGEGALRCTRISLKSGSKVVFDPVEDRSADDTNVQHFVGHNHRRSDALFSPFPYYQESLKHSECQNDSRYGTWAPQSADIPNDQHGVISLENLDHREPEYSGSFQASGYDLTGVGGLDLDMRFSRNAVAGSDGLAPGPAKSSYTITFLMAYDAVHEVSPSGVIDITNAVL